MNTFLVECFVPGVARDDVSAAAERVRAVSAAATDRVPTVYVAAMLLLADEVVFHVFRSTSEEAVRDTCTRAELAFDRVLATEWFTSLPGADR